MPKPETVPGPAADARVLGIETSCDETAAAVVRGDGTILSSVVRSQIDEHRAYAGVVPEIAARAHQAHLAPTIRRALSEAGSRLGDLSGIAATGGPGLIGGVMVGTMTAKAMASVCDLPFLAINHLEAHALTARLVVAGTGEALTFPYLLLLVSGGHCQLVAVQGVGRYRRLGTTIDDAVGEAFDKTARILGLGYPGGPAVERLAADATAPERFPLPRPLLGRPGSDFSFSGLKTAVRQIVDRLPPGPIDRPVAADLAGAFQAAVGDILADRTAHALAGFDGRDDVSLVVAGGVAANRMLRSRLAAVASAAGARLIAPPPALCTDNAAMVAWAGLERLALGQADPLSFKPRPRWPLDPAAEPALGSAAGKAGAKA